MSKGWAVEITSKYSVQSGIKWRRQVFDVAIEDRGEAIRTALHQTRHNTVVDVVTKQCMAFHMLSPGRVRAHPATQMQELPGGETPFSPPTIHADASGDGAFAAKFGDAPTATPSDEQTAADLPDDLAQFERDLEAEFAQDNKAEG
jgi:phosphoribosylformylglycinamidine (FGAM) synthase PurS component